MKKLNIPQDVVAELGFDAKDYKFDSSNTAQAFEILVKMNDLLTVDQKIAVMERQGCHKTGQMDKASKDFGHKHAGKSLVERLEIMSADKDAPSLNDDGTISLPVRCYAGDIDGVLRSCHCIRGGYASEFKSFIEEHPDKVLSFSQLFCGCCAGHQKHHLQNKLGVKLKLKAIDTSAVKTEKGQKRVFVYEIAGGPQ